MAAWGGGWGKPPLLVHFGTSLVERAVIDAFCRAEGTTFGHGAARQLVRVRPRVMHGARRGSRRTSPRRAPALARLPPHRRPHRSTHTREITDADRVDDGLPQSLEDCIARTG
jgi:hypothetical protein